MWKPVVDMTLTSHLLSLPSTSKGVKAADNSKIKLKNMVYTNEPKTNIDNKTGKELPLVIYHTLEKDSVRVLEVSTLAESFSWRTLWTSCLRERCERARQIPLRSARITPHRHYQYNAFCSLNYYAKEILSANSFMRTPPVSRDCKKINDIARNL